MTALTHATALTREHIKAMRAADSAVFRWEERVAPEDASGYARTTIESHIDLSKEVERGDGFGRDTLRVQVPTTAIITNHGQSSLGTEVAGEDYKLRPAIAGDWVLLSLSVRPNWVTFANTLKVGDEIVQRWVVDNRSIVAMRAGVSCHELTAEVRRPAPNGRQRLYSYMLDAEISFPGTRYGEPIVRRQP